MMTSKSEPEQHPDLATFEVPLGTVFLPPQPADANWDETPQRQSCKTKACPASPGVSPSQTKLSNILVCGPPALSSNMSHTSAPAIFSTGKQSTQFCNSTATSVLVVLTNAHKKQLLEATIFIPNSKKKLLSSEANTQQEFPPATGLHQKTLV